MTARNVVMLDLAGVAIPETVDGRSLAAHLRGEQVTQWREHLHGEHVLLGQSLQWVTDGKRKYVWMSGWGDEQFFDLEVDPQETRNLVHDPTRADEVRQWRQKLVQDLSDREEGFVADGELVAGQPVVTELSQAPIWSS
ncbi:sulfatase/phosphatase domain-containing protein [Kribbella sp. NPDC058245]|uniref:sulfatase/phosphatase domain-containing protein n=1 Tax=Kribbella sp. NPDC058245 TaxID=3346399 RepID=UPI0036E295BB